MLPGKNEAVLSSSEWHEFYQRVSEGEYAAGVKEAERRETLERHQMRHNTIRECFATRSGEYLWLLESQEESVERAMLDLGLPVEVCELGRKFIRVTWFCDPNLSCEWKGRGVDYSALPTGARTLFTEFEAYSAAVKYEDRRTRRYSNGGIYADARVPVIGVRCRAQGADR